MKNKYTLKQALEAKDELIRLGFYKKEDFYLDENAHELGYYKGEYFIKPQEDCDWLINAYEHYRDYLWSTDEEAQEREEEYFLNLYANEK